MDIPCESIASHPEFQALGDIPGIVIDLRYASANNFAGRVLYAQWDGAWLRTEAAQGLRRATDWLHQHQPDWRLVVLDALRPHRVQEAIWRDVVGTPAQAYFANPALGSIHSYGLAVDVGLCGPDGTLLDMGSDYDEMHERSHPEFESRLLARGVLAPQHLIHRGWLYEAMAAGGFRGIATEWWHFECGDRHWIRQHRPRVV
jgi:D-alanyl-D-alanine dipeptidase